MPVDQNILSLYDVKTYSATTTAQSVNIHPAGNVADDKLSDQPRIAYIRIKNRASGSTEKLNVKIGDTAVASGTDEFQIDAGATSEKIEVWANKTLSYIRDSGATGNISFEIQRFY